MTITERVESILRHVPSARNSDKVLLITFMQKFGLELTEKQIELFKKMPSVETIRRTRQSIQEQGKYPPTKEVEEARYKKYQAMKQSVGLVDPEYELEDIKDNVNSLGW